MLKLKLKAESEIADRKEQQRLAAEIAAQQWKEAFEADAGEQYRSYLTW